MIKTYLNIVGFCRMKPLLNTK